MLRSARGVILISALMLISACTSNGTTDTPTNPTSVSSSAPTPPTTATSSPANQAEQAAVAAYRAFNDAVNAGLSDPSGNYARAIAAHSVDPARASSDANIASFRLAHIAFRGTPPEPRIEVTGSDLTATPWPTVNLIDCPTVSGTWKAVNTRTGDAVPITYPSGSAKPPHAIAATVAKYRSRWVVQNLKTDVKHTCVP